jgi:hypothetical protein
MRLKRSGLAAAVLVGTVLLGMLPGGASAASPAASLVASAQPSERPPDRPPIEVWLDHELPASPPPGSRFAIGATLWDTLGNELPRMGATIFLRVVPPDGGKPAEAVAISDWRGHYRGSIEVPAGGLDHVEFGVSGTICENDVCRRDDWVFPLGGVGPPPAAPATSVAEARIVLGEAGLRSGEPTDLSVVVQPNADWGSWPRPAKVVVRAREARGPAIATATLPLVDSAAGSYEGTITIPRAGDLVLEAASDADGGDATRFGTSMIPVTVVSGRDGGDAAVAPLASDRGSDDGIPTLVVALLAVAAVAGAAVIVAGFRSGAR